MVARARRTADTRERIRAAAAELFDTIGYDATTTQAIAKRAGVAVGTIFVHASDKPDLLSLVMVDRLARVVDERFASVPPPQAPLIDRLMHVFSGLFRMYGEHPKSAFAFVRHYPGAQGPNARRVSMLTFGFIHHLARLVADAQREGEVAPDLEPVACAQNLFGLYFMALMTWLSGFSTLETELDHQLRASLALQIRGLAARPDPKGPGARVSERARAARRTPPRRRG